MSQKFTYEGYTICVTFTSDNAFAITASYNLTGEHFINDMVELGKIKKDTVLATLSKKSPKNLWCQFKMVDCVPRKLIISFVVNFDYLPEFSEDITLDYMQIKGEVLNKISATQLQSDISEVETILDVINKNGPVSLIEKNATVSTKATPITDFEVNEGSYLLQISGVIVNASVLYDTIQFVIKQENINEEIILSQKSHTQHGYGYPYFFSRKIDSKGGKIEILSKNTGSASATLSNQIVTLIPILGKA